jgi:hypothetical protein
MVSTNSPKRQCNDRFATLAISNEQFFCYLESVAAQHVSHGWQQLPGTATFAAGGKGID